MFTEIQLVGRNFRHLDLPPIDYISRYNSPVVNRHCVGVFSVVLAIFFPASEDDQDLPDYHNIAPALEINRGNDFGSLAKKLITESTGSGSAFFDYDGDGDLDLYNVNGKTLEKAARGDPGAPNQLFRNLGEGRFAEVAHQAGVADNGWGGGAAAADYDNDGDPDLLVTNYGRNVFYRNNGDGTFTDSTERVGIDDPRWSTSAAFGDVDGDGFPDLYVCNYIAFELSFVETLDPKHCQWHGVEVFCGPGGLPGEADALYLNQRDGTFVEVTREAGVYNTEGKGLGVTFLDFDRDGDQDIFVANDSTPDFLYENDGGGRFRDIALVAGVAVSMYGRPQAGMGVDIGDYDGNGLPDIVVTNFQSDYNALRNNEGGGIFTDVSDLAGLSAPSFERLGWGVKFIDANLDGFLDLFIANGHVYPQVDAAGIGESYGQHNQLLLNVPGLSGRRYEEVSADSGAGLQIFKSSRGMAVADYDNDHDLDVFINNMSDVPTFLQDQASHRNGSIRLTLVGRSTHRDGMGARVEFWVDGRRHSREAGAVWSYLSTNDPRLLLGLGTASRAEKIVIHWPPTGGEDPNTTTLGPIPSGEDLLVMEGVGRLR